MHLHGMIVLIVDVRYPPPAGDGSRDLIAIPLHPSFGSLDSLTLACSDRLEGRVKAPARVPLAQPRARTGGIDSLKRPDFLGDLLT